jgi:hypothetical protein
VLYTAVRTLQILLTPKEATACVAVAQTTRLAATVTAIMHVLRDA